MSEFTVDSADLALSWLDHHRDMWAGAYSVTIQPNGYLHHPSGGILYSDRSSGARTIISVQGEGLRFPDDAIQGGPDKRGYRSAVLIVSDDLGIDFTSTPKRRSDGAV